MPGRGLGTETGRREGRFVSVATTRRRRVPDADPKPSLAGDPAAYELAYDEGVRALEAQAASRDGVRDRAGVLLSAGAVVAGFLAPAAGSLTAATAAGGTLFAIASGAALYALLASPKWRTSTNTHSLLVDYIEATPPASLAETHRSLAYYMQEDRDENERELRRRNRAVTIAAAAVALETLAWLAAIYG